MSDIDEKKLTEAKKKAKIKADQGNRPFFVVKEKELVWVEDSQSFEYKRDRIVVEVAFPSVRVDNSADSHVVVLASGRLKCMRCGRMKRIYLPSTVERYGEVSARFLAYHRGCRE